MKISGLNGEKKNDSIFRVFGNNSIPGIDVTSGSLGHGVGIGSGIALDLKSKKKNNKVYVIISEGELYEGSTWETNVASTTNLITKNYFRCK